MDQNYLIDTGSDISALPAIFKKPNKSNHTSTQLHAANGTIIKTYGSKAVNLDLGLRRNFNWEFIITDVNRAILGADFLSHHNLLVDLNKKCLIDGVTGLTTEGHTMTIPSPGLSTIASTDEYHHILTQFPSVTTPQLERTTASHKTQHYIETSGRPVYSNED
ncbi:uncharacterized protein LOC143917240 [Arctopsyche grandis]|uniref:uncharacterized protein LOC143917240 n=1 Tax=Arctopsyche grandis TaxID=121162 RepID=UPI00406D6B67